MSTLFSNDLTPLLTKTPIPSSSPLYSPETISITIHSPQKTCNINRDNRCKTFIECDNQLNDKCKGSYINKPNGIHCDLNNNGSLIEGVCNNGNCMSSMEALGGTPSKCTGEDIIKCNTLRNDITYNECFIDMGGCNHYTGECYMGNYFPVGTKCNISSGKTGLCNDFGDCIKDKDKDTQENTPVNTSICTDINDPEGCTPVECTEIDTPYKGCIPQKCTDFDIPYKGCIPQECSVNTNTPYNGCIPGVCTDINIPYPGCKVPECTTNTIDSNYCISKESQSCLSYNDNNYIHYKGFIYRTLDGKNPHSDHISGSQLGAIELPDGFIIAPENNDSKFIAITYPWEAESIILGDGGIWNTNCNHISSNDIPPQCKRINIKALKVCGHTDILCGGSSGYFVPGHLNNTRILIRCNIDNTI